MHPYLHHRGPSIAWWPPCTSCSWYQLSSRPGNHAVLRGYGGQCRLILCHYTICYTCPWLNLLWVLQKVLRKLWQKLEPHGAFVVDIWMYYNTPCWYLGGTSNGAQGFAVPMGLVLTVPWQNIMELAKGHQRKTLRLSVNMTGVTDAPG